MKRHYYFAYGSNLDCAQMRSRCPGARLHCSATLHGYQLAFAGHSPNWGGAVATLVTDPTGQVPGIVWSLSPAELGELDRYEGHPWAYRRRQLLVDTGKLRRRRTHLYIKDGALAGIPSKRYSDVLISAYQQFGFDAAGLIRALTRLETPVFVYGTLRQGESNHYLLEGREPLGLSRTRASYDLLDLGRFPGMVAGGSTSVVGEVYMVDPGTLKRLDALEGHPNFYLRQVIRLEDGIQTSVYLLNSFQGTFPQIDTGDWTLHNRTKAQE